MQKKKWYKNNSGSAVVEYALLVALIGIVAIAAVKPFGEKVNTVFDNGTAELGKLPTDSALVQ